MGGDKVKDSACETQSNQNIVEMVGEGLLFVCFPQKKSQRWFEVIVKAKNSIVLSL